MKEIWKSIPGLENTYSISTHGRVRRDSACRGTTVGYILSGKLEPDGYRSVHLSLNGKHFKKQIHVLSAETFIGPCPKGYEVNHIDGDKTNLHSDNFEYLTRSENLIHSFKLGLRSNKGEKNPNAKVTEETVKEIRIERKLTGASYVKLAKKFNCSRSAIADIILKRTWINL